MPYYVRGLDTYYKKHQEFPKDAALRKQIIKDWYITRIIASIEKCILDKSRIISDITQKIYREREYNSTFILPDNLPLEEPFKEWGWISDGLKERIYYKSSIPYIYHLLHLEYIKAYQKEAPLSYLELIYPTKMPTKDYFPFVKFDIGTKNIPLVLTKEEQGRRFDSIDIDKYEWCYCIVWIDKDRMFISLIEDFYYFKQIGNNVHVFELLGD